MFGYTFRQKLVHWVHHLFNPHCRLCIAERELREQRSGECKGCQILQRQIEVANEQNMMLAHTIANINQPPNVTVGIPGNYKPIKQGPVPWRQRQNQLQKQSIDDARRASEKIKNQNPEMAERISALEQELGVEEVRSQGSDAHAG